MKFPVFALFLSAAACSMSASPAEPDSVVAPSPPGLSGEANRSDASTLGAPDASDVPPPTSSTDGAPKRQTCTSSFGNALTSNHGRLDGYLVAVVTGSTRSCNNDGSHVHVQVSVANAVYDVAVNLDTLMASETIGALPDVPWVEGWHAGAGLDYASDLGLSSTAFAAAASTNARRSQLETLLATANHVAIFATGYGPEGAHLVHRQGNHRDGAIILDPLAAKPRLVAFRFASDVF